jgi:sarcosine oxidase subunit delta
MKLLHCPGLGLRNIDEFVCGGSAGAMPDPAATSDSAWSEYLFLADNPRGRVREWWFHVPSARWFIAERDTVTDEIIATHPAHAFAGS